MAKIAVIIPAYNVAQWLDQCLESVKEQSMSDFEVIVVDDGSTDLTCEIARAWAAADPRFRVISQQNAGLSNARNTALNIVEAPYITMLDSDDTLLADALQKMLDAIEQNPDIEIVCGEHTHQRHPHIPPITKIDVVSGQEAAESTLRQYGGWVPSAWGKLFAAHLFENVRFTPGIFYEDLDLIPRVMCSARKVAMLHTPVYYYRKRSGSILGTFNDKRFDVIDVTNSLCRWAATISPTLAEAAADRRMSAAFNMLGLLGANDRRSHPRAKECWSIIRARRRQTIIDSRVRLKTRLGAALAYLGPSLLTRILGKAYKML